MQAITDLVFCSDRQCGEEEASIHIVQPSIPDPESRRHSTIIWSLWRDPDANVGSEPSSAGRTQVRRGRGCHDGEEGKGGRQEG
jgi:hypothetical protein